MNNISIGSKIKQCRKDLKISQAELGEMLGVSWEMISRYENGRSSAVKHLDKIAKIFGKEVTYFMSDTRHGINVDTVSQIQNLIQENMHKTGAFVGGATITKAPIFENYDEFSKKGINSLLTNQYDLPSWVSAKYSNLFVFRLRYVKSERVQFTSNDIAVFTASEFPTDSKLCLLNVNNQLWLDNPEGYMNDVVWVGKLIYIERRFLL